MGGCKSGLAVLAASCALIVWAPSAPAKAAPSLAMSHFAVEKVSPLQRAGLFHHRKRTQAFYCYPRKYWWFYRPYTTAPANYERCMPYFHYLDEAAVPFRGGRPSREIK